MMFIQVFLCFIKKRFTCWNACDRTVQPYAYSHVHYLFRHILISRAWPVQPCSYWHTWQTCSALYWYSHAWPVQPYTDTHVHDLISPVLTNEKPVQPYTDTYIHDLFSPILKHMRNLFSLTLILTYMTCSAIYWHTRAWPNQPYTDTHENLFSLLLILACMTCSAGEM